MKILARSIVKFQLWFASYRMQRINHEMAYGDIRDLHILVARKSDIQCEIQNLRDDLRLLNERMVAILW